MLITFLLILHGILAMLLVGAVTHQALGVFWPRRPGQTDFVASARGIRPQVYVEAIIVLFIITFILGATIYPTYRVYVRPPLEDLRALYAIGLFEMKENFLAIMLATLPAYWFFWRRTQDYPQTRAVLTALLVFSVWFGFITGHILNNVRGFG
jgi:hypothetical protein